MRILQSSCLRPASRNPQFAAAWNFCWGIAGAASPITTGLSPEYAAPSMFPIAPMTGAIRIVTWLMFPLPVLFGALGFFLRASASAVPFYFASVLTVAIWLVVLLVMRPTRFEVNPRSLNLVFPLRKKEIPRADIASATLVNWRQFCALYPRPIRVGVGGLWGGFGYLRTRNGRVDMFISTGINMVLVERHSAPPLLISPANPSKFVASLSLD